VGEGLEDFHVEGEEVVLHPDFGDLVVRPGTVSVQGRPEWFSLINLIAYGGAAAKQSHMPAVVGRLGPVAFWQSTGADDALPFWNTNLISDSYLYLVNGEMKVELKEVEGSVVLGTYTGRTGDLMRVPKDVAHRTYSTNHKRRIVLALLEYDERWSDLGWIDDVEPADDLILAGLRIEPGPEVSTVRLRGANVTTDSSFLGRGARAILSYGGCLGHNEFEGGFSVSDGGDDMILKVADQTLRCPRVEVMALLKRVIAQLGEIGV
jgi:hypothetical protein